MSSYKKLQQLCKKLGKIHNWSGDLTLDRAVDQFCKECMEGLET